MSNNNNNKLPQIISPQEFLKILQAMHEEQQNLSIGGNQLKKKKYISIEDYAKQAVENMLDKLGIEHSQEED